MFKFFLGCFLVLTGLNSWGQVSVISVTDEDKHSTKEDFTHTFEYFILPLDNQTDAHMGKCQATRISRRWFATAAHCLKNSCAKGCRIEMDLLEQPISALAEVKHTPKNPAVFIKPDFSYEVFAKNDLALIRLDLDHAPMRYYKRSPSGQIQILQTKQQFEQFLAKTPAARRGMRRITSPSFPPILVFDNDANYLLDRKISVISIFDGKREVKPNPNPVHYVKKLELAYTKNFGIRRGMSGSGVMSNTGEFVGIISGILQVSKIEKNKAPTSLNEWFLFFAFNRPAIEFMKEVMGSDFYKLDLKDAYPGFVSYSRKNYKKIIEGVKGVQIQATSEAI